MAAAYMSPDPFASAAFEELRRFVLESAAVGAEGLSSFEDFERGLHKCVMSLEADLVRQKLAQFEVEAPEIEVNGEPYRRKMQSEQEYCGLAGPFVLKRNLYVPRGGGGRAICPLELRAGIVEGAWTPLAARVMARAVASTTPKEAAELFEEIGGMKPSSSSLDRLPKRLSEAWEKDRVLIEEELRSQELVPARAVAAVVSLDGVHAPMKDAKEGEAKPRRRSRRKAEDPTEYREVGCGTVSLYDQDGNRLETKRYARMPQHKKSTLKEQLEAEVASILSIRADLTLVCLADGAADNWEFLEGLPGRLDRQRDPSKEAIDLFHVLERVKKVMDAYHGKETPESRAEFEVCRIWLREKADGVERVLRAFRYRRDRSVGPTRSLIAKQIGYFQRHRARMGYKKLLDANLPVGSGVVEAACKTLVAERMKRSGMSWRQEGGQAILNLRGLIQSQRWDSGWEFLAGHYRQLVTITTAA